MSQYTSKSIKFNQMISSHAQMFAQIGSRWCLVWKDYETGEYHLDCGYEGMPADYNETYEEAELSELENSMRDFANFRHFTVGHFS